MRDTNDRVALVLFNTFNFACVLVICRVPTSMRSIQGSGLFYLGLTEGLSIIYLKSVNIY